MLVLAKARNRSSRCFIALISASILRSLSLSKMVEENVTSVLGTVVILGPVKGNSGILSICSNRIREFDLVAEGRELIFWTMLCG